MSEIVFSILLRRPSFPVIVVSAERLYSAFAARQLAGNCACSMPIGDKEVVPVVDSTGEEFWYYPDRCCLIPAFFAKRWTKKRLIVAFNGSTNAECLEQEYSMKSLSNKRLDKVVRDICVLLRPQKRKRESRTARSAASRSDDQPW
jgi:hypothetical protein